MAAPPSAPRSARISVEMTDEQIIERLALMFRVAYHSSDYRVRKNPKWAMTYQVRLRGSRAVELMKHLRPLMGERRQKQIDRALASALR